MTLNWIGGVAALATFLGIWIGHVTVRKVEYRAPDLRVPMFSAVLIGLALEVVALSSSSLYVSGACGILGMTALFDALEFRRQFKRVKKGHAPANPNNPRHAALLAEGKATTDDVLKRKPTPKGQAAMNFFGLTLGIAALFIIGFGFVWVIRGEYYLGYLWWPYVMGLGFTLIVVSLFFTSVWLSALIGVFGASLIWGSTELKEQAVRAELGWYRFNPHPKPQPPFVDIIKKIKAPHL